MDPSGSVDVAAVADSHDQDHQAGVDDFMEDPVATDAHPFGLPYPGLLMGPFGDAAADASRPHRDGSSRSCRSGSGSR